MTNVKRWTAQHSDGVDAFSLPPVAARALLILGVRQSKVQLRRISMSDYVNLKRLELLITFRCTSDCIHCYSTGTGKTYPPYIDKNMAIAVIGEIGSVYDLDSIMTFGGEPLLYPEIVCAIHEKAAAIGINERQVITNGCWTRDKSKARNIAKLLASSGVNHVAISVDAFHQECMPLDMVRYSAEALLEVGITNIKWNPCWLVSSDSDNRYNSVTRTILTELEDLSIATGEGNVVAPEGRAAINLSEYFERKKSFPGVSCQDLPYMNRLDDIQSICIEPNGDLPLCKALTIGNVKDGNIVGLLESYNPYSTPEIKAILDRGVQVFVEDSNKQGIELEESGYYTICDLCCSAGKRVDAKLLDSRNCRTSRWT